MRNKIILFLCVSFITALNTSLNTPKTSPNKTITIPATPKKTRVTNRMVATNREANQPSARRKLNFEGNNINIIQNNTLNSTHNQLQ